jgi:hypothetical protein
MGIYTVLTPILLHLNGNALIVLKKVFGVISWILPMALLMTVGLELMGMLNRKRRQRVFIVPVSLVGTFIFLSHLPINYQKRSVTYDYKFCFKCNVVKLKLMNGGDYVGR